MDASIHRHVDLQTQHGSPWTLCFAINAIIVGTLQDQVDSLLWDHAADVPRRAMMPANFPSVEVESSAVARTGRRLQTRTALIRQKLKLCCFYPADHTAQVDVLT